MARVILVLVVVLAWPSGLVAGDRAGAGSASEGVFDGYDPDVRRVWINDFAYLLDPGFRVVGSPTRAGTISAIRKGEVVWFVARPNPTRPAVPILMEIRRR